MVVDLDARPTKLRRLGKIGPEHATVTKPSQVKSHVDKARENKMKSIIVLVERGGSTRFVGLKLEES